MGVSETAGGGEWMDQATTLAQQVGQLQGQVKVLEERLAAADAVEEHLHIELDAARADAADARADLKEWQARAEARSEEWRIRLQDMGRRLDDAEASQRRAEDERATVIAALGRRGRRQLDRSQAEPAD
jgi:flagellar biosynthesis chaperone FliJ